MRLGQLYRFAVKHALVTNAAGFAGPPAVEALLGAGFRVFAHDASFHDATAWSRFHDGRDRLEPVLAEEPEALVDAAFRIAPEIDAIISNDHVPAPAFQPEDAPISALRDHYAVLVEAPFRLIRAALPRLRRQAAANVVMVTSNRMRLPLSGGAFPDAARAAANAMVRSLAVDCARDGVIVNAIAPNFLYSEAYYPRALFVETERGREYVRRSVPAGRLAEPEEIGEVILFLATVRTRFLTGAVVEFSGGWPFGPARPT